jgi:branched-chain amino acid transport system permease protein
MVETFAERELIGEAVTMGYVMLVVLMLITGWLAARLATTSALRVLYGLLAAGVVGAGLVLLAVLTEVLNLGEIFPFASPDLIALLTVGRGLEDPIGIILPVVAGAVSGIMGGGLAILPAIWRRSITLAVLTTILIALLRDVIAVLLPDDVRSAIFTSSGLTYTSAVIILLVMGGIFWAQSFVGSRQQTLASFDTPAPKGHSWQWWFGMALLGVFLFTFPLWSRSFLSNVACFVGLYIIMGLGLNMVIGFAGMLDLGFVAFYAIGAYTMAILTSSEVASSYYNTPMETGFMTFWEALPFSMLCATIGGAILALPILKMRGDYLAIATLGFGEIIRILALSDFLKSFEVEGPTGEMTEMTFLGGAQGITRIARPHLGEFVIQDPEQFYYLILIGCFFALFISFRLKKSRLGRAWMAIREDEDVAQAMGINRVMVKLSAFVIGAFLGGLSGGIFASLLGSVVPKSFELLISINVLALIIVGGMGSLPGVIVGALAMVGLPELLREFGEYRMLVYGAVVVAMMLYRPQGLWPEAVVAREMEERKEQAAQAASSSSVASSSAEQ